MFDAAAYILNIAQRFVTETPVELWFAWFFVGILAELAFGHPTMRPGLRGYAANISHSVVYLAAIFSLGPTIWYCIARIRDATGLHGLINAQIFDNSTYLNQVVISFIFLFLLDFFQYWWHRIQHSFPFLWEQHVVHHSDEAINVTTAVRHHWTEFMFQAFAVALPLSMLFKITPESSGFVGLLFGGFQFYLHSNIKIHLGRFSWVIGTPGMHRIHHSILPKHQNKNFAAYFPIWDVVFGTYYCPTKGEFPPTGVAGTRLRTVLSFSAYPFIMWARRVRALTTRLHRITMKATSS